MARAAHIGLSSEACARSNEPRPFSAIERSAISKAQEQETAEPFVFSDAVLRRVAPSDVEPRVSERAGSSAAPLRLYVLMIVVSLLTFGTLVAIHDLLAPHSPVAAKEASR